MTFARLRGDDRKGSIMNMSLACRARACPAIAAGCRALRPTARNKASAACPAPSGMKSGRNRCFVDSLRWRKVDLNHRFRAWTRFGFGLPDGHRGSHGCGNPRQDRPTQPGATEPRLRQHRPRSAKSFPTSHFQQGPGHPHVEDRNGDNTKQKGTGGAVFPRQNFPGMS